MAVFILNNREISTDMPFDTITLDFLRLYQGIKSIKAGCRTGSCGSCLILVGELNEKSVSYRPLNSCILPLEEEKTSAQTDSVHQITDVKLLENRSD